MNRTTLISGIVLGLAGAVGVGALAVDDVAAHRTLAVSVSYRLLPYAGNLPRFVRKNIEQPGDRAECGLLRGEVVPAAELWTNVHTGQRTVEDVCVRPARDADIGAEGNGEHLFTAAVRAEVQPLFLALIGAPTDTMTPALCKNGAQKQGYSPARAHDVPGVGCLVEVGGGLRGGV